MTQTIKGGAYQSADGSWHDANGKPLPPNKVKEAEELFAQVAAEQAEAEEQVVPVEAVQPVVAAPPKSGRKSKGTK